MQTVLNIKWPFNGNTQRYKLSVKALCLFMFDVIKADLSLCGSLKNVYCQELLKLFYLVWRQCRCFVEQTAPGRTQKRHTNPPLPMLKGSKVKLCTKPPLTSSWPPPHSLFAWILVVCRLGGTGYWNAYSPNPLTPALPLRGLFYVFMPTENIRGLCVSQ